MLTSLSRIFLGGEVIGKLSLGTEARRILIANRHSLTAGLESTYKMLIGKTQECRRLLLQTGADPTVYIPASGESYTYFMLHWYDEVLFKSV